MDNDLIRLKKEYAERMKKGDKERYYSQDYPPHLFALAQRKTRLLAALAENGVDLDQNSLLLEIGCGGGGVLTEYLDMGVAANHLFGIDLLFDRLEQAHSRILDANLSNADGQALPYSSRSFDIVLQYTAFSSVLNPLIKKKMAQEMLRVLKPGGLIIWYDFWWNPLNRQTRGIAPREIKVLFPHCSYSFTKITLAPPIARLLIPRSRKLAGWLESVKIFNSHYLVLISD